MSISVLLGLIIGFGALILGFTMEEGLISTLVMPSSFIIVVGGTIGAIVASFGITGVLDACKAFAASLMKKNEPNPTVLIEKLTKMSDESRQQGLLRLQTMLDDPDLSKPQYLMLKEGMILAMDMNTADKIREALESDTQAYIQKKQTQIEVFEGASGYSPTMGIIGTVMGLVQVLGNITDMASLTKSISVAFLATLYGVVFANLVYLPIANHLKCKLKRDKIFREMIIDGICMIATGENSRNMVNKLSLYYQAFPNGDKKYINGINN